MLTLTIEGRAYRLSKGLAAIVYAAIVEAGYIYAGPEKGFMPKEAEPKLPLSGGKAK